jgi:hypothetical protein
MEKVYETIVQRAERDEIYDGKSPVNSIIITFLITFLGFQIERTFHNWFSVTLLHVWMVLVRLRAEGKDGNKIGQYLFNQFWKDVESRMISTGV